LRPGASTAAGTLNLDPSMAWVPFLDGLSGACAACATGGGGTYVLPVSFSGLPVGVSFSAQVAIMNPANLAAGLSLSNPLTVVTTP
jgi:hypothetical protein